jgi:hypothetical protein
MPRDWRSRFNQLLVTLARKMQSAKLLSRELNNDREAVREWAAITIVPESSRIPLHSQRYVRRETRCTH